AVAGRGHMLISSGGSAADLEDLAATLRARALQRRLAVLHRDPLRVHDFDLHLVLDAIGFSHGAGSSSYGVASREPSSRVRISRSIPEGRPPARRPGCALLGLPLGEEQVR